MSIIGRGLPVYKTRHPILLYHKGNLDGLKADMLEFQNQFMSTDPYSYNIETNWLRFKLSLNNAINKNIPQAISKTQKHLPWLNSAIRKKMQKRKHLYNKAKSTGSEEVWLSYRKIRNEITKEINEAHKAYQEKLFDDDTNSSHKNFWRYIRRLRKDNTGVAPLKHQNFLIGNPRDKAEILNDQFYSVFTHEDLSDLSQCADPAYSSIPDVSFSTDGILKLIKSLNINKASGPDNISARVLTICAEEIAPILMILFTQSFNSGELPNDWLTANITPVFKKGDKSNPSNYSPISLTSLCCKLMEHILCHNIMNYFESNHILNDYQYGFRSSHSCQAQLISIIEELQLALDCHHQVDLLMLDFSKTFDTVPHQHLLKKLKYYGINGKLYYWLSTWLIKRSQIVVDGYESKYARVISGVPQGTILGPVMFLLYINIINNILLR